MAPRAKPKLVAPVWTYPVSIHEDGRKPRISDGHHSKADVAAKRAKRQHRGQDIMYRRRTAARRPYGHPWSSRWHEIPRDVRTPALAAFTGRVIAAGIIDTGGLIMLDHGDGIGTAYHHLRGVNVGAAIYMAVAETPSLASGAISLGRPKFRIGDIVPAGYPIGVVGGSPTGRGLVHLHFDKVTNLNAKRSTLRRGRLFGTFQDARKEMKTWAFVTYDEAWADVGRVGV